MLPDAARAPHHDTQSIQVDGIAAMKKLRVEMQRICRDRPRREVAVVSSYRLLHVDDEPLMRELVDIALGLDPAFMVMSCASAQEALGVVVDWAPDLILCDVMMPEMDGLALLQRLRADPATAKFPLVFTTARAKPNEIDEMKALGAAAVIAKPFDPTTLANTVRRHLQTIKLAATGFDFTGRLRNDAAALTTFREKINNGANSDGVQEELQSFAHKLAGAAGVFNYRAVSTTASALEDAILELRAGRGAPQTIETNLDALIETVARAAQSAAEETGRPT
jgi:CheY-like chemotaxis protein